MSGPGATCEDSIRCNMSGLGLHVGTRRNAKIILKSDSNNIKSDDGDDDDQSGFGFWRNWRDKGSGVAKCGLLVLLAQWP